MDKQFKQAVLSFIRQEELIRPGDRVIAAASGGADSMALLQLLMDEKEALEIGSLEAVHVDHRLRPGSVKVADFVEEFCRQNGVRLHRFVSDAEIGHRSEEWSRDFRYSCFETLAGPKVRIATAHTLSDQAETLLFRLARGTGVRGACGIPAKRGPFIRPMLTVTKKDAEQFCALRGIAYITDPDNLTDDYARNRIRHYALPALDTVNPKAQAAMGQFCRKMSRLEDYLGRQASGLLARAQKGDGWEISALLSEEPVIRQAALTQLVEKHRALRGSDLDQLEKILKAGRGRLFLGKNTFLSAADGLLQIQEGERKEYESPLCQPLKPGKYRFPGGYCFTVSVLTGKDCEESIKFAQIHKKALKNCADYDKLSNGMCLRTRQPGDVFRPAGRNVQKSLKKLYNELEIPGSQRLFLPLAAEENQIRWIWGQGFAHGLRPDSTTVRLLVIEPETED